MSLATEALDVHANLILSRELSAQAGRDLYRLAREGDRDRRAGAHHRLRGVANGDGRCQAALQRAIRNRAEDEIKDFLQPPGETIKK